MSEQTKASVGPMAAWRERRRAKRQERIESRYFQNQQVRSSGLDYAVDDLNAASRYSAYATPWVMSGGDFGGGGCGGDGGGGGC
jgi:uncharacterized membrane protein